VGKTYMAAGGIKECEIDVDKELLRKHHSVRCFEFAIDILDLVGKMILNSGDRIIVKIGIHKGKVIPAVVGAHKPQFSLIGDAVNTTSRMSSNGEKNCITCSEFAYEEIKAKYKTNFSVDNKDIKGKGKMNLYSYTIFDNKKHEKSKNLILNKEPSSNYLGKTSTKNALKFGEQNSKYSKRKYSVFRSGDISINESINTNNGDRKSLIEDSMLIVENSQDLFLKTGGNEPNNIFSDLNRFGNDANAYKYQNTGDSIIWYEMDRLHFEYDSTKVDSSMCKKIISTLRYRKPQKTE
jgi:hypothetical protein